MPLFCSGQLYGRDVIMKRCPSMPWFSCTCRGVSRTKMKDCRKPINTYESKVSVCSIHRSVHFKRGMFPVKTPKINVCARMHLCFTVLPLVESLPGLRMKLSPQWACVRSSYLDNPYAISQPLSHLVMSGRNLQG